MAHQQGSILSPQEETALLKYITYLLTRYKRHHMATSHDVYDECILRYLRTRRQNKTIGCQLYWMKSVAFNIVYYELYREEKKLGQPYDPQILQEVEPHSSGIVIEEPLERLINNDLIKQALLSLSKDDQLILQLHFFKELSWEAMYRFYAAREKSVKGNTLRKRYSRAYERLLKKLTKLWHESE